MTKEEAINLLDLQLHGTPEQIEQYSSYQHATAIRMAIASLKKEIPKPISIENGFVKCGGCGMYIRFPIADHYNNCPECGQKILWKGESE